MKRIFFLLIAAGALSATAQTRDTTMQVPVVNSHGDSLLPRWVIDVNVLGGILTQNLTTANSTGNYLNGVNMNQGDLAFHNGTSIGFDAQLGVFFGKKRHWGIGTGIMYLSQTGDAELNNFHAEYQSTDDNGNIYRQVVSPNQPIKEELRITNVNIPLLLKYKNRFSDRWGFTADGGLLFNVQMKNKYTTNASFDYEAIYQYSDQSNNGLPTVYDNSSTPSINDHLITKSGFAATDPGANAQALQNYFSQQRSLGRDVGLGVKPTSNTGSVSYATGSLGFLIRPAFSYYLSDNVALNFGVYYLYQGVNTSAMNGYTLTKKLGDYSSTLNNVTKSQDQSYGLNIGVRFLLGKKHIPLVITSEDAIDPTACGLADGIIVLHGLTPAKDVTVNYSMNGKPLAPYTGTVAANGTVKLTGLAAGSYSDITATSGKDNATGIPVSLVNPPMTIASEFSTNPSAHGACDGSITISGLRPDQFVTVDYNLNGAPQPHYSATVSRDKTVTIPHLCAGAYSHVVVTMNNCTANGSDITLTEPYVAPVEPMDTNILSNPIYFETNKTVVHVNSYPTLKYAAKKLNEDKSSYIIVNGYTDNTGILSKNMVLSVKRAESVKAELVGMGVDPSRIKVIGNGPSDPVGSNKTTEGKAANRRAVMRLDVSGMDMKGKK